MCVSHLVASCSNIFWQACVVKMHETRSVDASASNTLAYACSADVHCCCLTVAESNSTDVKPVSSCKAKLSCREGMGALEGEGELLLVCGGTGCGWDTRRECAVYAAAFVTLYARYPRANEIAGLVPICTAVLCKFRSATSLKLACWQPEFISRISLSLCRFQRFAPENNNQ